MGIQWADVEGYRFSRDDVRAKALANLYSQALGEEFTRSIKPFEVDVVAEVGEGSPGTERNASIASVSTVRSRTRRATA